MLRKIHCIPHYIGCIRRMGSGDSSDTKIPEAAHNNIIKDGYYSSHMMNSILRMSRCEACQFHMKLVLMFNHTVLTLIRVWQDPDDPLRLQASWLEGGAPPPLLFVPADK